MFTNEDVEVVHSAVDSLPGGAPAMIVVGEGRVDVIFSRAAGADEYAAAFPPMWREANRVGVTLCLVA